MHYDFRARRDTPNELRALFRKLGWRKIVAFQTRNPLHRAHQELTFRAAKEVEANLLIHPVVGMTKPGDVDHFTRVRCYEAVLDKYPGSTTTMSLLNLAMRMAGPREALWHALIRRNHGCTHFIVGRDHAGPGKNSQGEDFYGPYDAQEMVRAHQDEIGIELVPFKHMVYVQERAQYEPIDEIEDRDNVTILNISGTELRPPPARGAGNPRLVQLCRGGGTAAPPLPAAQPAGLYRVLHRTFRVGQVHHRQRADGQADGDGRPAGDAARWRHRAQEPQLGTWLFQGTPATSTSAASAMSPGEITKNGGIALCAPIAPYATTRRAVREDVEQYGAFIEVHVSTSLEECERRDRKGLYKLAREGKIKEFTGISDPYDVPQDPELRVDTEGHDVDNCAHQVILKLEQMGLIAG